MSFSQRQGIKSVTSDLQIGEMNEALRTRIWNCLDRHYWSCAKPTWQGWTKSISPEVKQIVDDEQAQALQQLIGGD